MSNELWAVHAQGPDDIYPAYDRADAERHAAELNAIPTPPGILVAAVVIPSPWPASQHWQYLAEQEREHKQELLAHVAPTDANLSAMLASPPADHSADIDKMVSRFLSWPLPDSVCVDAGVNDHD